MTTAVERLGRILTLIPYVQSHQGVDVEQVAAYIRCTPQEVIDDLGRVLMCGVPPYMPDDYIGVYLEADRVYVRFAEHFRRPICLTLNEALALRTMLASLPVDTDSPQTARIRSIQGKVDALFSTDEREALDETSRNLQVLPSPGAMGKKLRLLERALERPVKVVMNYYALSKGRLSRRVVHPYAIIDHMGQWYLVGFCEERSARRVFRVDRIRDLAVLLNRPFTVPDDFDMEAYHTKRMFTGKARYTLRVRFHSAIAPRIIERYAAEQIEIHADGSVILDIDAGAYDWAVPWLLKYGELAEAIEPEEVRSRMLASVDRTLQRYEAHDHQTNEPEEAPTR